MRATYGLHRDDALNEAGNSVLSAMVVLCVGILLSLEHSRPVCKQDERLFLLAAVVVLIAVYVQYSCRCEKVYSLVVS